MDINLLRSFLVTGEELHFGRAARRLNIMPSGLSRNIRLLEEYIGVKLFDRTTRNVSLTNSGRAFLSEARTILEQLEKSVEITRQHAKSNERVFRVGAIDSAATGLMPQLIHDFSDLVPDVELRLTEDKTVNMLPKLISGTLDIAFVRPPVMDRPSLHFEFLLNEEIVVALPESHALAKRDVIKVSELAEVPMIVPSPRNRPHSHKVTMSVFSREGLVPRAAQTADEKHTIIRLVGTGMGAALVPSWTKRIVVDGVVYRKLVQSDGEKIRELPLSAAWVSQNDDPYIAKLVELVKTKLETYAG